MTGTAIRHTPWDAAVFGFHTAEISEYSEAALQEALKSPGHYTIRVDPLANKSLLHHYGFYYCDTLIEPYCVPKRLRHFRHSRASISKQTSREALLAICHGAFSHGRFHRDFNLDRAKADQRYDNWLCQLYDRGGVYGLYWDGKLAGFIACSENSLVLHAVEAAQRGQGRAKYWWSEVGSELFAAGYGEIKSSISASNLAALNLYASLGFAFRCAQDVYHRFVE